MPRLLDDEEITRQLLDLEGWSGDRSALRRTYTAPDFATGIRLVDEVAREADEMNHHPDIDIRWTAVTFMLWTHVAGGVTQFDVELAHRIADEAAALGVT